MNRNFKRIAILLTCLPIWLHAQEKGIHFEDDLTWEQVKSKAKAESKYIFMDCYATWCGPCKTMEMTVYPKDSVGMYMNSKFVSVKVQLDTSKYDNEETKVWYGDAKKIRKEYAITALPTFLFFNSVGDPIDKEIGAKKDKEFVKMVSEALSPSNQYYNLLSRYEIGKLEPAVIPQLANKANYLGEKEKALKIAKDYMDRYLDKLSEKDLLTNENLRFMASFNKMITTKDRIFDFYYRHPDEIDPVMGKDYAYENSNVIIQKEEIEPGIVVAKVNDAEPKWNNIYNTIERKYNSERAKRLVLNAKVSFYYKKDWDKCTEAYVAKTETYGLDTTNSFIMIGEYQQITNIIFRHATDPEILNKAVIWMEKISKNMNEELKPGIWDTYAGLLYKTGRTQDAIALQEKYTKYIEGLTLKNHQDLSKNRIYLGISNILTQMQNGESGDKINWTAEY